MLTSHYFFIATAVALILPFSSSSEMFDGNGLFCIPINENATDHLNNITVYYFEKGTGYSLTIDTDNLPVKLKKQDIGNYVFFSSHIGWCAGNSYRNRCHEIDRKTLELKVTNFGKTTRLYQCRISDHFSVKKHFQTKMNNLKK